MDNSNDIITEKDIKQIFTGSILHVIAVAITYLSATFIYSIVQRGIGSASDRLTITTNSMWVKLDPVTNRLNSLLLQPDNFGFTLYGDPPPPSTYNRGNQTDNNGQNTDKSGNEEIPKNPVNPLQPTKSPTELNTEKVNLLINLCKKQKDLNVNTRNILITKAKKIKFSETTASSLLVAIGDINRGSQSSDLTENQLKFFVEFFSLPPDGIKNHLSQIDAKYIIKHFSYGQILTVINNKSLYGLKEMLPQTVTKRPTTPKPTKATNTTVSKTPETQNDYNTLETNELLFRACIDKQEIIQSGQNQYNRANASADKSLNMQNLVEMGFIDRPLYCPSRGVYSVEEDVIICSTHGNSTNPCKEHIAYLRHFKRFHLAQDAFNEGKYKEALFLTEEIVKNNPEQHQAVELLGHCQMKLQLWQKAGTTLKQATAYYKNDGLLHYQTAICFYTAGNKELAETHLKLCITSTWNTSQRNIQRTKKFFLLKDQSTWMLKFVKNINYLNFKLQKEPQFATNTCYEGLANLKDLIKSCATTYLKSPKIQKLQNEIKQIRHHISTLRNFETDELKTSNDKLDTTKNKLNELLQGNGAGSMAATIEKFLMSLKESLSFCPGHGRYFIDSTDNLDCSHHRLILNDSNITSGFNFSPSAIALINKAILAKDYENHIDKHKCHKQQKEVIEALETPIEKTSLSLFKQAKTHQKNFSTCPSTKVHYKLKQSKIIRRFTIVCPDHGCKEDFQSIPEGKYGN